MLDYYTDIIHLSTYKFCHKNPVLRLSSIQKQSKANKNMFIVNLLKEKPNLGLFGTIYFAVFFKILSTADNFNIMMIKLEL